MSRIDLESTEHTQLDPKGQQIMSLVNSKPKQDPNINYLLHDLVNLIVKTKENKTMYGERD